SLFVSIIFLLLICCGDKEPPLVEITNPADDSYVNGIVLITAEANDNKGVDSIKLFIDDYCVAQFSKSYAYYLWNTDTLLHNSLHFISAIAIDPSMNVGADTITVTIQDFGSLKWRYRCETQGDTFAYFLSSPAVGTNGTIYYGATGSSPPIPPPGYCLAVNLNGDLEWTSQTSDWNSAPAIGSDGIIYVAHGSGSYIGGYLSAITPNGLKKWMYTITDNIVSGPAIDKNGNICIGDYSGFCTL
ncbi:MAG: Ig-like domain-containing protein, partial [candidate division WOR-3 bacterium]